MALLWQQYSGKWNLQTQGQALGAGTWTGIATGELWGWGYGSTGALGQGNTTNYSSPVQVGALTDWASVSTGYQCTLATKTDGTLWAWGSNAHSQLGTNNATNYSSPVQVGALTTWLNIAGGFYHSLATTTDGKLYAWGYNGSGQAPKVV